MNRVYDRLANAHFATSWTLTEIPKSCKNQKKIIGILPLILDKNGILGKSGFGCLVVNSTFMSLNYSARKNATAMVLILGASEGYLVKLIFGKYFHIFRGASLSRSGHVSH